MVLSLAAAGIGAAGLLGWIFDVPALKRIHPSWVTMKANTAICLMLMGMATATVARFSRPGGWPRRLAAAAAVLVVAVAAATMAEHVLGVDLGIDQVLFAESEAEAGRSFRGRMGPASAFIFGCLGLGVLLADVRTRSDRAPATACVIGAAFATVLIFVSYFVEVELHPAVLKYVSIAFHTVVAFVLLSMAGLLARPERGMMAAVLSPGPAGQMVRRLLPAVLVIPTLAGWVFTLGREQGFYGKGGAVALQAVSVTLAFTWLVISTTRAMNALSLGRRVAEGKMAASERLLTDFFNNAAVGMAFVDLEGRWEKVNDKVCLITGYSRDELLGHSFVEITHPDDIEPDWDNARRLLDGSIATYTMEKRYLHRSGSVVWINLSVSLQRDDAGRPRHFITVFKDVTEKRRASDAIREAMEEATASRQRAEAASRAKDDFLAALSHELRTPLTPVLMIATELAGDEGLPSAVREQLRTICQNVTLEARLIDDLLDLTRVSRGKLELRLATVDTHAVIRDAVEIVRGDMVGRALDLRVETDAGRSHVEADPTRLRQVVWNLLKNAVKFTPDGGKIVVRTGNPTSEVIRIEVADTGCGIPAEAMERIFLPFDQGKLSGRHRFGGLGLGLSISKALMEAHGATVCVSSDGVGCGSTFATEMRTVEPVEERSGDHEPGAVSLASPVRVMVVDDHRPTLDALVRVLERRGFHVCRADSVAGALALAGREPIDVLVSDLGLPDGTGLDLLRGLREKAPVEAVAISGYGMENDLKLSREAGFAAHLVKPINLGELVTVISRLGRNGAAKAGAATPVTERQ